MKNNKKYKLLAVVGAILLLGIFIAQINLQQVQANLQQVGWQFGSVLLITGIAYAMASTAWLLCFKVVPPQLTASKLFIYRQIGETLTTINPANIIVGESAKIYLLNQEGVAYQEGLVSILLSRVLIFLSMIALFVLLPVAFYQTGLLASLSITPILLVVLLIAIVIGLFYSMVHPNLLLWQFVTNLNNKFPSSFLSKMLPKIEEINRLLYTFYQQHQLKLLLAFLLSLLHWLMGAVEIFILLHLLNIPIPLMGAILIEVGVTCIKSMGAFIPGQIGVEEYGNKIMLGLVDISGGGIWLTISILRRTRQVFWLLIGGVFFLLVYRKL